MGSNHRKTTSSIKYISRVRLIAIYSRAKVLRRTRRYIRGAGFRLTHFPKPNSASPVLFLERLLWMPTISNHEFWRQRAAEMRAIADGLAMLPHAKASILQFADE